MCVSAGFLTPGQPRCYRLVSSLPSSSSGPSDTYSQVTTLWRGDGFLNTEQDTAKKWTRAETQHRGRLMPTKVKSPGGDPAGHTGFGQRGRFPEGRPEQEVWRGQRQTSLRRGRQCSSGSLKRDKADRASARKESSQWKEYWTELEFPLQASAQRPWEKRSLSGLSFLTCTIGPPCLALKPNYV